jgi:hypothetical protein
MYTINHDATFQDVLNLLIHQFMRWKIGCSNGSAQVAFAAYFTQELCADVLTEFEHKGLRLILQKDDDDEDDDEVKYSQYRLTRLDDVALHPSLHDFA